MFWFLRRRIADFLVDPRKVVGLRKDEGPDLTGDRDIEWSWVESQMPDGPGEALDFGNGGSPLSLVAAGRGFNVTAIDLTDVKWPYVHPRIRFIRGDVLETDLPAASYALVINCSTVEHAGLKGRYGISRNNDDADLDAMKRLKELMKSGGIMLLTVPVGRDAVVMPLHRIYGEKRLPLLISGYRTLKSEFWIKQKHDVWECVDQSVALEINDNMSSSESGAKYYGLGCFVLAKSV